MATYCGVDFHARQQLVKWCNTDDGEIHERQLGHQSIDEVREFYAQFTGEVVVGFETSGYSSWLKRCWKNLAIRFGLGMRPRFGAGLGPDRRRIGAMPN